LGAFDKRFEMEIPSNLIPVEGYPNLYRDKETGMLVSTDYARIEQAKRRKAQRAKEKENFTALENKVDSLESKLDTILRLLENK